MPLVPARNRRVGEFLKELKLAEGRGTGLPNLFKSMQENGSGAPDFDFDENGTYFRVTLPAHPEYVAVSALRDAAHLKALGDVKAARERVQNAWEGCKGSPSLTVELIRIKGEIGDVDGAEEVFRAFKISSQESFLPFVINVLAEVLIDNGQRDNAEKYLEQQPELLAGNEALDVAILARRIGKKSLAHRYFDRAGGLLLNDIRAMHEFAQTKIDLGKKMAKRKNWTSRRRLLGEARELLERVLQMDADKVRHAWAWRDLGRVKNWLKCPLSEVKDAYFQAIKILPEEAVFQRELSSLKQ